MSADGKLSNEPQGIERPLPSEGRSLWGSDVAGDMMRALDIPYVALNPGASYRGLHDSIVNRLGNEKPQMLLCLHEEAAVAVAHGWAKVTGKPMGAIVHSNVGLLHSSMAVFNAWMDRAPLLLFGATGPVDATKRRPWIDWIHTTKDQAALIRNFIKWDDQPGSVAAIPEAMLRAKQISTTAPCGPTYICFDAALQEQKLDALPAMPDASRFPSPVPVAPPPAQVEALAQKLHAAQRPLLLMGRFSRSEEGWKERVALAEALGAVVLTEMRNAATFPTDHPLAGAPPLGQISPVANELMRQADLIVSLDWVDLGGALMAAAGKGKLGATVVRVSVDQYSHHGFGMEYHVLPPADLYLTAEADPTVTRAARGGEEARRAQGAGLARSQAGADAGDSGTGRIGYDLCAAYRADAAEARRRAQDQPAAPFAVLAWSFLADARAARQPRHRWRRRRRLRPRHFGRHGARAQRQRPVADRRARRWRFPHGQSGDLDGGALPRAAARHRLQQPLLL